ncbi:hypothetical protein T4E_12105, partial [Trichinella pseudospiralis]
MKASALACTCCMCVRTHQWVWVQRVDDVVSSLSAVLRDVSVSRCDFGSGARVHSVDQCIDGYGCFRAQA